MVKSPCFGSEQTVPVFIEAPGQRLELDSTLAELPLVQFQVEAEQTGIAIAHQFEQFPQLPGVVLHLEAAQWGMISRQRLLEYLIRPHGMKLFLPQPLRVLHSYARCEHLVLAADTPILVAAQLALRRPPDQRSEPLLVQFDSQTCYLLDIHELNIAYWQIRGIETQVRYERTQTQMIQSEKMAALGRLVDGVAHEILDPVGFIWGNLAHVSEYTRQLLMLMNAYEQHFPQLPVVLKALREEIELDYLETDLPRAIESIRTGGDRLKKLAAGLQNFCHIDDVYSKPANLHECLDSILLLLKSRLSGEIQVVRNYGHLPPVSCYIGQLSQVLMNILTNAVNALLNQAVYHEWAAAFSRSALPTEQSQPQITITTQVFSAGVSHPELRALSVSEGISRWVSICIANNGVGLSAEQQRQILESFSVEKRAEKETSLAVSYQIVTAKHGGHLLMRSVLPGNLLNSAQTTAHTGVACPVTVGASTEFEILLPLT